MGEGAKDFRHGDYRHPGGSRKSYVVWTAQELGVLESIATENQDAQRQLQMIEDNRDGTESESDRSSRDGQDDRVAADHGGSEGGDRR